MDTHNYVLSELKTTCQQLVLLWSLLPPACCDLEKLDYNNIVLIPFLTATSLFLLILGYDLL